MKKLLLLLLPLIANADENAKEFFYQYTPTVEIHLLPDACAKEDVTQGWQAYAKDAVSGDVANGCWRHNGDTVQIWLDAGGGKYIDYELYKDKFEARY